MNKTVLITGCAGFIGSNFAKTFIDKNPTVRVIGVDDLSTGKKYLVHNDLKFYKISILDEPSLNTIVSKHKPDSIFHFAALTNVTHSMNHPHTTSKVNVLGTLNLLEQARVNSVRLFVNSSSAAVYGEQGAGKTGEGVVTRPKSPYGLQKLTTENFCKMYSEIYNLNTVSLRYFSIFGPGQFGDMESSPVIPKWLQSVYFQDKTCGAYLEGDGHQTRDFCFVDDAVLAALNCYNLGKFYGGESFNVGSGVGRSLLDVISVIENITGKKLKIRKRHKRKGDIHDSCADLTKSRKTLLYKPHTNFAEQILRTTNWFVNCQKATKT